MQARDIEKKWQSKWEETGLYKFDENTPGKKLYVLEMFSYPSGAKLHVGHWYNFGPSDTYARFKRLQGYNVFHPMGFDAFGLPAENYAIKTGIHPKDSTYKNIDTMEKQIKAMGATYDWDYEVITCDPSYYKWTQWIFLQLLKNNLAYRKEAPVNWCPSCNTVLANEQVVGDGHCERCGTPVIRKNLTQWFFKITDYADELLEKLDDLDWPEKTKAMQRNWIGRSKGANLNFKIKNSDKTLTVFTTRPDTLFGCTYMVLAPEHPIVNEITTPEMKQKVEDYIIETSKASEIDRLSTVREKTGIFTGAYAINPINGEQVPIWIADYVLYTYGTGAIMAVPAHDERDYEFAKKFDLEIRRVVKPADGSEDELPNPQYGIAVNSGKFDGLTTEQCKDAIVKELQEIGVGEEKVNYRLRDWLVSRQRYWGAPIPVIHCDKCGIVPVPEDQLPVMLPYDVDFTPDGASPLRKHDGFMNVKCPICGGEAHRDPDTMDTFVCSSWYFLRYPDNRNDKEAFNREKIDKLLPVDKYIGGAEHAVMHLLYARFFVKALRDMGYLDFDEPFNSLVHQGVILGTDGFKMSKSRGNVASPDEYIEAYGADVFRLYLMFGFSYIEGGAWNDEGIKAVKRFLDRAERLVLNIVEAKKTPKAGKIDPELEYVRSNSIKSITTDTDKFQFNTAIARMMELVNALYKYIESDEVDTEYSFEVLKDFIKLIAPFCPHFAEEMWEVMGLPYSVFNAKWPEFNEAALNRAVVNVAVQINGKVRTRIDIEADMPDEKTQGIVLADEKVKQFIGEKQVKKVIIIKNKIVNIVVG